MYKLIGVLYLIVAVTNGQVQTIAPYNNNSQNCSAIYTDTYLVLNRYQHVKNIENYDSQMDTFKTNYATSLNTIDIQRDMLINDLERVEQRLNLLEILSDFSRACVKKYRSLIPTVLATKTALNGCVNTASSQVNNLLSSALSTRNTLNNYYSNNFENDIKNCEKKFNTTTHYVNYTMCVTSVTSTTNTYTVNNQKTFNTQMDSAQCSGQANIKKALDCSFVVQNRTISAISEANTLINTCFVGQPECKKCSEGYTCSNIYYMKRSEVDYQNKTMANPFYGRYDLTDCLMMQIY